MGAIMAPLARRMTEAQIDDVAAYFENLADRPAASGDASRDARWRRTRGAMSASARTRAVALGALALALAGCTGEQSVLAPRGPEAARVALLSWVLFAGGAAIMLAVLAAIGVALLGPARWRSWLAREAAVTVCGVALPVALLTALLAYGLALTRSGGAGDGDRGTPAARRGRGAVVVADRLHRDATARASRAPTSSAFRSAGRSS